MCAYSGVKAYTVNNLLCIKSLYFSICIKLIKIAYTQSKISICKKLYCFSLCKSHKERINIFLYCTLLKKFSEFMGRIYKSFVIHISSDNNTARIKIIIESLAFTKKFRTEDYIIRTCLFSY